MIQDKTLADYIKRTQEKLQEQNSTVQDKENPNDYKVYPEYPIDSDYKRNPYSPV